MATLLLRDVLKATGGTVLGPAEELELSGVSTDTRDLRPGSLFVALRGPNHDAHDYLVQAGDSGARAALVDRPLPAGKAAPLVQIRVADTRAALADLAGYHARRHEARRVAITGSNGKTTTKELLAAILSGAGPAIASQRSFNNDIGVPLTLLRIEPDTSYAAVEIGCNAPGEIQGLARLVEPEVGIITNCSEAHVERLGDLDGVIAEKGSLLEELPSEGVAVLNADDPAFARLRERAPCPVVTFGVRNAADFRATDIRFDLSRLTYHLDGARVFLPLGGCHNVYNSLASIAAATVLGVPRDAAIRSLRTAEGPPMRLRPVRRGPLLILDDTYNANPGSVEAAFRTLAASDDGSRKIVILGDMKELGEHAPRLHRSAGGWVSLLDLGLLVAVGRHAEHVRAGALDKGFPVDRIHTFEDAATAALAMPGLLRPGDTILVKGSRAMAMEQVVESLAIGAPAVAR